MTEVRKILVWETDAHGTPQKVVRDLTEEELESLRPTPDLVNGERDRRLQLPFPFGGKMYQRDAQSVMRINGAVSMALAAMAAGTAPDARLWVNGGPFQWITADNTVAELTPAEVIQLGMACATIEKNLVFAARELKDMETLPFDFADDKYWP